MVKNISLTEKQLDRKSWCGVETGLRLIELPLVSYGDRLMWKKSDASHNIPNESNGP